MLSVTRERIVANSTPQRQRSGEKDETRATPEKIVKANVVRHNGVDHTL